MSEHTRLPWMAYVENLGHGHHGRIKLVTQRHLDENLPAIGEIESPHDADLIISAVNAHKKLLKVSQFVVDAYGPKGMTAFQRNAFLRCAEEYDAAVAAIAAATP